jgi:hypothetical protein
MLNMEDFDHNNNADDDTDLAVLSVDGNDDDDDKSEMLSEKECLHILEDTLEVHETVSKV